MPGQPGRGAALAELVAPWSPGTPAGCSADRSRCVCVGGRVCVCVGGGHLHGGQVGVGSHDDANRGPAAAAAAGSLRQLRGNLAGGGLDGIGGRCSMKRGPEAAGADT